MARYLIELTTTTECARGMLENPEDRSEAVRPLLEAAGCKLEQYYFSLSGNTIYEIVESPDQYSLYALLTVVQANGAVSSIKSTPIITASEAVDVFKKSASLAYRPPGK